MKKFISLLGLAVFVGITGCEETVDNCLEIINNGGYQVITIEVNGFLQTSSSGEDYFGPFESRHIKIRGDDGDPTTIVVRIWDMDGYYLGIEIRTYYKSDNETREIWVIPDYFRGYVFY